ncbi:hypothetical protein [Streptomyces sp. NBC_00151]|uniref:hypothetical protein n=1 Tax=Streptomyces sp. NBC_00151 TaxID=2975669 RepID=UPI002DDBB534|nr:hypothetical protein [Streptomyces sp. NBC_00151]WRZ36779.1 hypothetical protein OG915_01020 [Streptomyces sp. NBC_00151]WRZ44798.1 hypothetical protein OG915_46540 [Streptomyces sp. NBC_00151]
MRLVLLGVVLPAMTCMARSGLPVSTTRDAGLRFKHRRYRYQIDLSRNPDIVNLSRNPDRNRTGTDVNATIEKQMEGGLLPRDWRNYKPREREVAVVGSIDPLAVVRVYDYVEDRTGTWNPGANEVDWVPGGSLPNAPGIRRPAAEGSEPPETATVPAQAKYFALMSSFFEDHPQYADDWTSDWIADLYGSLQGGVAGAA